MKAQQSKGELFTGDNQMKMQRILVYFPPIHQAHGSWCQGAPFPFHIHNFLLIPNVKESPLRSFLTLGTIITFVSLLEERTKSHRSPHLNPNPSRFSLSRFRAVIIWCQGQHPPLSLAGESTVAV